MIDDILDSQTLEAAEKQWKLASITTGEPYTAIFSVLANFAGAPEQDPTAAFVFGNFFALAASSGIPSFSEKMLSEIFREIQRAASPKEESVEDELAPLLKIAEHLFQLAQTDIPTHTHG